jgi:hypothetical protein
MKEFLNRACFDARPKEWCRCAILLVIVLSGSALWYGTRDFVVYQLAKSSTGCPGRNELIVAGLRQCGSLGEDDVAHQLNASWVESSWIAWTIMRECEPAKGAVRFWKSVTVVADLDLIVRGEIEGHSYIFLPPDDRDGDGRCEIVMKMVEAESEASQDLVWWVVARILDGRNEIVWVGLVDEDFWHSRSIRPKPIWRDEDGDGREELVFITVETVRTKNGGIIFKPPEAIAVFEWASSGGILRTKLLSADSHLIPWRPAEPVPLLVEQDADLEQLVREFVDPDD